MAFDEKSMGILVMQPGYRAIFIELILAEAAAVGAFAVVTARFASLMGVGCQAALVSLAARTGAKIDDIGPSQADGPRIPGLSPPAAASFCRALAGLPRVSMTTFLSQYDDLRGRRGLVRDISGVNKEL